MLMALEIHDKPYGKLACRVRRVVNKKSPHVRLKGTLYANISQPNAQIWFKYI